jgi:adenosine kinase
MRKILVHAEIHSAANNEVLMKIAVAGSIARDHLMTFPGNFTDSIVPDSLENLSLSFLVDDLEIRRGGTGANIAFGLGILGINPVLIAAAGKDFTDYQAWLQRHGVDTSFVKISPDLLTATFSCTTDQSQRQIASFFPGAMVLGREIELAPILEKYGKFDLFIISPDDPEAMLRHTESAKNFGIDFIADPSQTLASISGAQIRTLISGAKYLFTNGYELELTLQKTQWSDSELLSKVGVRVTTLGGKGSLIEQTGAAAIEIGVPKVDQIVDPTGVGDSYRSGFIAGLARGFSLERCGQIGATIAAYCLETKGTQEYRFERADFISRLATTFGKVAGEEVAAKL